jgi:hypothetical protein
MHVTAKLIIFTGLFLKEQMLFLQFPSSMCSLGENCGTNRQTDEETFAYYIYIIYMHIGLPTHVYSGM